MIRTPLTPSERVARVRQNILAFNCPRLPEHNPAIKLRVVTVCGYGPSLAETWGNVIGPVMTTSGAHDYMLSKGVVPKYHVELDPRVHKSWMLEHPHKDVRYYINSQCHPSLFEKLRDYDVVMWHSFTGDDDPAELATLDEIEPGIRLLAGGSNVGMRAVVVARDLGHSGFELHGMDCCYCGEQQWAGSHFGKAHKTVTISVEGREFETSDSMMQSTDDFFSLLPMLPDCRFRVHGDGLLEARLKLFNQNSQKALSKEWWSPVNFALRAA